MWRLRVFDLTHLHVEVSSKCVLKCPRCPRTELKEDHPQINRDYSLVEFQEIFHQDVLPQIKYLSFCGDIGDPIYATDFLEIVGYVKTTSPGTQVNIVTNGSYKRPEWWRELGSFLNEKDRVTFSIDGWDDASNKIYRVNSDWDSIITGLKTLSASSDVNLRWSTILFRFNMHRAEEIRKLASDMGVDQFDLVRSMKFGSNDPRYLDSQGVDSLEPNNYKEDRVYSRSNLVFGRKYHLPPAKRDSNAQQACLNGTQMPFVSVDGRFFPCAWFGSGYMENDFLEKYQDRINVRSRGFDAVLNDPCWQELKMRWEMFPPAICKFKCGGHGQ
jgi:MoaA/NifB/PqqE/SkfB family radical SAM enzyme